MEATETDKDGQKGQRNPEEKDPMIARLGSIIIPGFGYMYTGKIGEGIIWTFLTALTYIFIVGILMHVYLIYNAGKLVDRYNRDVDDVLYSDVADDLETHESLI